MVALPDNYTTQNVIAKIVYVCNMHEIWIYELSMFLYLDFAYTRWVQISRLEKSWSSRYTAQGYREGRDFNL
jgi:hypothetical protein